MGQQQMGNFTNKMVLNILLLIELSRSIHHGSAAYGYVCFTLRLSP